MKYLGLGTLGASLLLAACGGGGGGGSEPIPPAPTPITLTLGADSATLPWNKAFSLKVLTNDSASRGAVTLSAAGTPAHGSVRIVGSEIEYTPTAGYAGSDSFSYTAKADDGSSATAQISLKVQATLTIKGVVSDGPIANAKVTASVGTQTFNTDADAQGAYRLDVTSDNAADSVLLSATGVGTQAKVKLLSALGDLASLAKLADTDGVLTPAQSSAALISHYSTALHALLSRANGQLPLVSSAQIEELMRQFPGDEFMDMALTIKLVVDDGAPLPSGVADTAALVAGTAPRFREVLNQQTNDRGSLVDTRRKEISAAISAIDARAFTPTQSLTWIFAQARLGSFSGWQFSFEPGGKAQHFMAGEPQSASWVSADGEITLTPDKPHATTFSELAPFPISVMETRLMETLAWKFRRVAGSPDGGLVRYSARTRVTVIDGPRKGTVLQDLWTEGSIYPFANKALLPKIAPLQMGQRLGGISTFDDHGSQKWTDVLELTGASTAKLLRSNVELGWRMQDGELVLSLGNRERFYRLIREDASTRIQYFFITEYVGGKHAGTGEDAVAPVDTSVSFKADASLYKRWQHGFGNVQYQFNSGGSGSEFNGVSAVSEGIVQPLSWSIAADGKLRIQRGSALRDWQLLRREGGKLVVLEGLGGTATTPMTTWRVNVFSELSTP